MAAMRVNTAVARMIVLNNHLSALGAVPREAVEPLVLMVAPVAPHIAEELWARLGHAESLTHEPFPTADAALLAEETVPCVVQVAGKVRDRIAWPADIAEDDLRVRARGLGTVPRGLAGTGVRARAAGAPKPR